MSRSIFSFTVLHPAAASGPLRFGLDSDHFNLQTRQTDGGHEPATQTQ